RLRGHLGLAVPFGLLAGLMEGEGVRPAGADVVVGALAARLDEVGHRVRHAARVLPPVDVAHARAGEAGVAAALAGDVEVEAVADAGVAREERGREVAVGLAAAELAGVAAAVAAVEPVPELVPGDVGDLAGVAAAAAGAEEVDRAAVP